MTTNVWVEQVSEKENLCTYFDYSFDLPISSIFCTQNKKTEHMISISVCSQSISSLIFFWWWFIWKAIFRMIQIYFFAWMVLFLMKLSWATKYIHMYDRWIEICVYFLKGMARLQINVESRWLRGCGNSSRSLWTYMAARYCVVQQVSQVNSIISKLTFSSVL